MSTQIQLEKLLNLSIGSPEIGAVNFNALRIIIAEIIKSLGLGNKLIEVQSVFDLGGQATRPLTGTKIDTNKQIYNVQNDIIETKVTNLENKLKILDELPSNVEIMKTVREKDSKISVGNIWQFIKITQRLSAMEEAIEKLSDLLENAISELGEMKDMKNDLSDLKKSMENIEANNNELKQRLNILEESDQSEDIKRLKNVKDDIENLQNQMKSLASRKELDKYMKWVQFESAMKTGNIDEVDGESIFDTIPDGHILEKIKQLGDMANGHETIVKEIQDLQQTMPKKAEKADIEVVKKKTQELSDDLIKRFSELNAHMESLNNWKDEIKNKYGILPSIKGRKHQNGDMEQRLTGFHDNLQRLNTSVRNLVEDVDRKHKHILGLQSATETLEQMKADKDSVAVELDSKARKADLENMISRLRFDASVGGLEQSVENILNRLSIQEAALQEAISNFNSEVDGKMDRQEIDPLKDYINKRIKANKCKHVELPVSDDSAAGMTKPAIKFHCISCARPVEVQPGVNAIPLPQYPAFPPSKSSRPYAPYEFEQMRQYARGNFDGSDHVSSRACGGQHTMTYSTRRAVKNVNYYYKEDEGIIISLKDEPAIQTNDGQLFKERENHEQLPTLHHSQTSPESPPKTPKAPANPQPSPRPHTPVRPRSAVIR